MRYHQLLENRRQVLMTDGEMEEMFHSEEDHSRWADDYLEMIFDQCGEWINEANGEVFFRGEPVAHGIFRATIRENRNPKDTDSVLHGILTEYLKRRGFKARRDNSVFVTSEFSEAGEYGHPYAVFFADGYDYTWNPKYRDLYRDFSLWKIGSELDKLFDIKEEDLKNFISNELASEKKEFFKKYGEDEGQEKWNKYINFLYEEKYDQWIKKYALEGDAPWHISLKDLPVNWKEIDNFANFGKFTNTGLDRVYEQEVMVTAPYYYAIHADLWSQFFGPVYWRKVTGK